MIEQGDGGAIVLISSVAGLIGVGSDDPGALGYAAAKHGIVGLMRLYANLLAQHSIRVNSVHPTGVNTPMINNEFTRQWLGSHRRRDAAGDGQRVAGAGAVEPEDIANAVAWLVSDAARYVTGVTLPVDAGRSTSADGATTRPPRPLSARWCWPPSSSTNRRERRLVDDDLAAVVPARRTARAGARDPPGSCSGA